MMAHVKSHTASFWATSFIHVLEESIATSEQSSYTPLLETETLLATYNKSKSRLLCFDYDVKTRIRNKKAKINFLIYIGYTICYSKNAWI